MKNLRISTTPIGVAMYLPFTARDTVELCRPVASATWSIVSGRSAESDLASNAWLCSLTIACATRRIVSCRSASESRRLSASSTDLLA